MESLEEFHERLHRGQISYDSLAESCWEDKTEIERLRADLETLNKLIQADRKEIERLQNYPEAIADIRAKYPEDVFPDSNVAARMARLTCDNIERLVREAADAKGQ